MSSHKKTLYPEVTQSNPEAPPPPNRSPSSSSSLYPSLDMKNLASNLFPDSDDLIQQNSNPQSSSSEDILIKLPGTIVHLIDKQESIELASGELMIVSLRQGENVVAVLARVGDEIQWPLAKDEAAVKLDESHYFFTLRVPGDGHVSSDDESDGCKGSDDSVLNYGLTIASKGQDGLLKELDGILDKYSSFSVHEVKGSAKWEVLDGSVAKSTSPDELGLEKKEVMEERSAAYWTTLAPNVEDYSGGVSRMIASGSGFLIKGILWCGDVTVDRLKWGNQFLKIRMGPGSASEISPGTLRKIRRVKKLTKTSEKMATGVLSGVVKVSGFFTSAIVNSAVGKKFFSLLPGEIILASLDGFNKVCDAVEVAGRNVMSTSSVVTTGLVSHRYGDQAAEVTNEGLDAAGHAIGTAWAVFKIRKAINPKSVVKPTTLATVAARASSSDLKAQKTTKKT